MDGEKNKVMKASEGEPISEEHNSDETEMNSEIFSVFILKSNATIMTQAETYLRNRGCTVGSGVNLKEALAYIIQKQPQFLLVSSDHPNKKVKILPKLVMQAFPVKVIGFAEKNSSASAKSLTDLNLEYVLYSPVSGPSIQRLVRKMKKDEETRAKQAEHNRNNPDAAANADTAITFKGDSSARDALNQLLSSGGDDSSESGAYHDKGDAAKTGPAYMGDTSKQAGQSGPAYNPSEQQPGESFDQWAERMRQEAAKNANQSGGKTAAELAAQQSGLNSKDMNAQQAGMAGKGFNTNQSGANGKNMNANQSGTNANDMNAKQSGANAKNNQANQSGLSGKDKNANSGDNKAGKGGANSSEQQPGESFDQWAERMRQEAKKPRESQGADNKGGRSPQDGQNGNSEESDWQGSGSGKSAPIMESEYKRKEKKNYTFKSGKNTSFQKNDSLIVKGTETALDETVNIASSDSGEAIEKSSNMACITVESPRFSGYLICALGQNRTIDESLITTIKKRLFEFLRSNGEQVSPDDTMSLKLQEVEFEDWAIEQADFLKKSVHDGNEIAMAFFPSKEMKFNLEESASEKMLKMTIDEFKSDTPIEFDLYIYMPQNKKYLLYTPQGMQFYGKQKTRLIEKGVTHLHLKKDSASQVKKYRAQNYLNDRINAFKAASKIKKDGS